MCGFRDALVGEYPGRITALLSAAATNSNCVALILPDGRDFSDANVQLIGIGPNPVADIKKWTDKEKINVRVE